MASTPKGPQKIKLDYYFDRDTYNVFIKKCTEKGYAPQIVIEKLMRKYVETGQI
jgi:hypothetical protein